MSGICGIRSPFQGYGFRYHQFLGLRPRLAYLAPLGLGKVKRFESFGYIFKIR